MTPTFHIGDLVEIIGPSAVGAQVCIGEKFTISEILTRADSEAYSDADYPWYPASSLRLMPKFTKGDRVYCEHGESVICPGNWNDKKTGTVNDPDYTTEDGTKCVIVDWDDNSKRTSVMAEDLRLVDEELKIGDLVRVSGSSGTYTIVNFDQIGNAVLASDHTKFMKNINDLRKLTPEEIKQHLHPVGECVVKFKVDTSEFEESLDKAANKMWKLRVDERLSAIEHRQGAQQNRMDVIEKRIDFIEAFQKHAAYTTHTYNPDDSEHGTITVHCSCGQKYEIEATPRAYQVDSEAFQKDECPNGHQIPNGEPIRVTIERGDEAHTYCDTCPGECLNWSEKVLDDMRVD